MIIEGYSEIMQMFSETEAKMIKKLVATKILIIIVAYINALK